MNNIRKIRKAQGMTIKELADISGLSYRTVQDAERNEDIKVKTAIKIADALDVTLDELCRDIDFE